MQGVSSKISNSKGHEGAARQRHSPIIGKSSAMERVFERLRRVAPTDATVLITGETGTGKGLVAKRLHQLSKRSSRRFMAINCGAIPANLLESELFGHARGAFTGATAAKVGKFEAANGGTVFLDEIGDMSPDLQVKLLKVLEERSFEPVGSNRTIDVDVRIVAATHRDLEAAVADGHFREDLYYRLFVIPIQMPALRDRANDVALIATHFLHQYNAKLDAAVEGFSDEAMDVMQTYHWPGNVRELSNLVERLVVLTAEGVVGVDDLPAKMRSPAISGGPPESRYLSEDGVNLRAEVTAFEKKLICQSLEKTNWVKTKAADLLKIKRTTLVEKIKRYELQQSA